MHRFAAATQLAFGLQLTGDEADGHDAEALGRLEQAGASLVPGLFVLEDDLVEAGEGVTDVGGVVDRQPPATMPVDVGERRGRQLGTVGGLEPWHSTGH